MGHFGDQLSLQKWRAVPEGEGVEASLIRKNFHFCLEPGCGVAYTKLQRSERLKLATLGGDSRSIHAIWMEVVKPDLGKTLNAVLDIQTDGSKIHIPIKELLRQSLINPAHRAASLEKANDLVTRAGRIRVSTARSRRDYQSHP